MRTKAIIKTILIILLISNSFHPLYGQEIRLDFTNEPLNRVLTWVRDNYGIELSFDDRALSEHTINANRSFSSYDELISFLIKDTGYKFEKSGNTFVP